MADLTKVTKSAEWHMNQAAQYKAELDALNPAHEAVRASVVELEAALTGKASEIETLTRNAEAFARQASEAAEKAVKSDEQLQATLAEVARLEKLVTDKDKFVRLALAQGAGGMGEYLAALSGQLADLQSALAPLPTDTLEGA